jgi:hypothetical protein
MSYGLYVENSSGFIQIDENYENLMVVQSGTLTSSQNELVVSSSITDDFLVFVRPNSPVTTSEYNIACDNNDDDDHLFNVFCWQGSSQVPFYKRSCDYAVCVKGSEFSEPTTGYGLNVYKPDGTVRWSSEYPQFRLQAARFSEVTASSLGTANDWYTGLDENIWCLGGAYGIIRQRVYSSLGETFLESQSWRARFNYPENSFSTTIRTVTGDIIAPTYDTRMLGNKVELLGYIT